MGALDEFKADVDVLKNIILQILLYGEKKLLLLCTLYGQIG